MAGELNFGGGVGGISGPLVTYKRIWGDAAGTQTNVNSNPATWTNIDLNFDGSSRFEFQDFDELIFYADNGGTTREASPYRLPTADFIGTNRFRLVWDLARSSTNNWMACDYVSASRCRISGANSAFGLRRIIGVKYAGGITNDSSPT